ncbi:MAG: 6,7-dimethyl-8-ribityllumazine synthase [Planctomycetaceae bacterium]|nr:6,7-dimethyl-8-ribityllumazine synthase [Planctomycetaceae bacterium]
MPRTIEGKLLAGSGAYAIVVARFNDLVTRRLLDGALDTLRRHGAEESRVTVVWAPGSFELPVIADRLARSRQYVAVICLGAVIQGQTTHHEYINHQVAAGLMKSSLESGVPVTFGVLTCQTMEQALDRAGGKAGNKGCEAALAAIETANVLHTLSEDAGK